MPEQAPDGSIVITPKEFYDGVRQDITNINTGITSLQKELSGIPARVEKLETEVSGLKARMAWFSGFAAALGAAAGSVITKLA